MAIVFACGNCRLNQNTNTMTKISILDQFKADAIGAPAVITGGGGGCKVSKVKTVKCKSRSKRSKAKSCKAKSAKSRSRKCAPQPPCWD